MTNPEKNIDQAQAYRAIPDFEALPRSGPGRWAFLYDDITLYTNDDNVLFVLSEKSTIESSVLIQAISKAYDSGESAADAFDRLRGEYPAVSGDLSDMPLS